MAHQAIRRGVAGATSIIAVGALTLVGAGIADAGTSTLEFSDGSSSFTRVVSNGTPAVGDTITVTTNFRRTSWVDEFIYNVKDRHPSCLTYVPGSAKMSGNSDYPVDNPEVVADEGNGSGYVRASWGATDWVVQNRPGFHRSPTFSVSYKVGADCARGTALNTGMDYGGSLGSGNYGTRGPSIMLAKSASTTTLAPVAGARLGAPTTLTATIAGGAPGNIVEFYDGTTKLGQGAVNAEGTATYVWNPSVVGEHSLTAKFLGSDFANGSQSAPRTVQVSEHNATSAVTLTPVTGAKVGTSISLTATVLPAGAGGTVTFKDGDTVVGTAAVRADGTATVAWTPRTAGERTITVGYSGQGTVDPSTDQATVTVAPDDGTGGGTGSLGSLLGGS